VRRLGAIALAAIAVLAAAAPAGGVPGGPHIRQFEYSEDYEGFGYRHSMGATIKGEAERVKARSGSISASGKRSSTSDTDPQGRVWFFRDKAFVKQVRADLYDDGLATVTVKAASDAGSVKKVCELTLEPDDEFGDYAGGPCRKG